MCYTYTASHYFNYKIILICKNKKQFEIYIYIYIYIYNQKLNKDTLEHFKFFNKFFQQPVPSLNFQAFC